MKKGAKILYWIFIWYYCYIRNYAVATFLDPRYKDSFFDEFEKDRIFGWLKDEVKNIDMFAELREDEQQTVPTSSNATNPTVYDVIAITTNSRKRKG